MRFGSYLHIRRTSSTSRPTPAPAIPLLVPPRLARSLRLALEARLALCQWTLATDETDPLEVVATDPGEVAADPAEVAPESVADFSISFNLASVTW